MRVDLNGARLHARVLNEALFCHLSPAATSRYILRVTGTDGPAEDEEQKSSGLWVGPAAGSTAAQKSAGGRVLPLASTQIQYVVREPYVPFGGKMRLVRGQIDDGGTLTLRSKMRQARLFLDGEDNVFEIGIGDVVTMRRSEEFLTVLGLSRTPERVSRPDALR
jgi:NAD+ kinase